MMRGKKSSKKAQTGARAQRKSTRRGNRGGGQGRRSQPGHGQDIGSSGTSAGS
jgi:hypothetical protein